MPRTQRSTRTPACDAAYSASMTDRSTSAFIFAKMRAGLPARARSACSAIFRNTVSASVTGATASFR